MSDPWCQSRSRAQALLEQLNTAELLTLLDQFAVRAPRSLRFDTEEKSAWVDHQDDEEKGSDQSVFHQAIPGMLGLVDRRNQSAGIKKVVWIA